MSFYKPVLKTAVGLEGVAILGRTLSLVPKPKKIAQNPFKERKRASERLTKGFMDIMIGTALIKPTAKIINTL